MARRLFPASLRGRLLLGIMLLVAVGLVGADLGAYQITRIWVLRRADEVAADSMTRANLAVKFFARREVTAAELSRFSVGDGYALYYDQRGDLLFPQPGSGTPQQAELARAVGPLPSATIGRHAEHSGSITADGFAYRVEYLSLVGPGLVTAAGRPGTPVRGIVIAISVQGAHGTLAKLASTEEIVTCVALLVLAGTAIVMLRVGLRPLAEIAAAAEANAAGDTDRRLPEKRHATEVDRVAAALNHAFDQRRHAEDQLRRSPDRLRQMLRNLVGNAFQHTPPGTAVQVTVEESLSDGSGGLRILVADDGPGIAQADRPHLFKRFYRSGAAHGRTGGTGLGLAITHAIVTAHQGTIDILDQPGGATFLVTLPRAPSIQPTPSQDRRRAPSHTGRTVRPGGRRGSSHTP